LWQLAHGPLAVAWSNLDPATLAATLLGVANPELLAVAAFKGAPSVEGETSPSRVNLVVGAASVDDRTPTLLRPELVAACVVCCDDCCVAVGDVALGGVAGAVDAPAPTPRPPLAVSCPAPDCVDCCVVDVVPGPPAEPFPGPPLVVFCPVAGCDDCCVAVVVVPGATPGAVLAGMAAMSALAIENRLLAVVVHPLAGFCVLFQLEKL
jgi:hypothetical protein